MIDYKRLALRFLKIFLLGGVSAVATHWAEVKDFITPDHAMIVLVAGTAVLDLILKWLKEHLK